MMVGKSVKATRRYRKKPQGWIDQIMDFRPFIQWGWDIEVDEFLLLVATIIIILRLSGLWQ